MTDNATTPDTATAASEPAQATAATVRAKVAEASEKVAEIGGKAVDTARNAAIGAAEKTAQAIEGNPMSVLVGGLAIGVIAGAMLPRSEREGTVLRPIGARLKQGFVAALKAARDTGMSELASAGISQAAAKVQVNKLLDAIGNAAARAGEAAHKAGEEAAKAAKALPKPPEEN